MPRENSFSDSEGRSLTPDPEDEIRYEPQPAGPASPTASQRPPQPPLTNFVSPSKRSVTRGVTQAPFLPTPGWERLSPKEKFRASVRKVMTMRRGTSFLTGPSGRIGAEPGVDPRRASADLQYGHIHQDCVIEVVDYSSVRSSSGRMTNREFVSFINDKEACQRDPWVKVRWINIGGISWDVIKAVSIKYNLHPLALEDVFHGHSQNRSKADYYTRHLFLRVLCHELGEHEEYDPLHHAARGSTLMPELPRSSSPEPMDLNEKTGAEMLTVEALDDERTMYGSSPNSRKSTTRRRGGNPLLPNNRGDIEKLAAILPENNSSNGSGLTRLLHKELYVRNKHEQREEQEVTLDTLKKGERVNVKNSPMFIFLFRDGTVISIHPTPTLEFTAPIASRLRQRDTVLRTSADAALLVHSLLDLIVDRSLQIIDEFHTKINKFERAILLKPSMITVRNLHIMSGDLILHKRTLEPIRTLIYGLRRYDVDRCAALIDSSNPANVDVKVVGFMSHKSKIYLADVFDHMEYILASLDMFANVAENLINYSFNSASYEMNEVMRRLTFVTVVFLPLTLLTGYFGMNFDPFWAVNTHSDLLFWEVALPVMAVVIPLFMVPDIKRMFHYIQKRMATKKAVKTYKQS